MNQTVAVIGDVMLDEFVYGDVHRISPEAATPVLLVKRIEHMPGGAANVARGIAALGCDADLVTVIGDDIAGRQFTRDIAALGQHVIPWISIDAARPTTRKTRFVSEQHSSHMLRVDDESTAPLTSDTMRRLAHTAYAAINEREVGVIVFSDYCKGVLTGPLATQLVTAAREAGKTVIVDTKCGDYAPFRGASILKINLCELGFCYNEPDEIAVQKAAHALIGEHDIDHIVVTKGESGLTLYSRDMGPFHVPGNIVRVRDVSGAGDTVVAVLAAMLAKGRDIHTALVHANRAAAIAVSKPGTATVTLAELEGDGMVAHGDRSLLDQRLREWRGQRIGFTNGCFDLLHEGHVYFLRAARAECDKLVVGVNDDESCRRLKGVGRPVQNAYQRATLLAALDAVDLVVIFNGDDPTELCEQVRPTTLFKGSDYEYKDIAGRQFAANTHIIPRLPDSPSTTKIIEGIRTSDPNVAHRSLDYVPITGPGVDALEQRTPEAMEQVREYVRGIGDDYCEECHGPCRRRPRHGEHNI